MKSNVFNVQECHQNVQLQIFIQANITVRNILVIYYYYLLSGHFIKWFPGNLQILSNYLQKLLGSPIWS